jgi:hypothetical protein
MAARKKAVSHGDAEVAAKAKVKRKAPAKKKPSVKKPSVKKPSVKKPSRQEVAARRSCAS